VTTPKVKKQRKMELPAISKEELCEIVTVKLAFDEAQALANEAKAKLDRLVVQCCARKRRPVEATIICLDCGSLRSKEVDDSGNLAGCPVCFRRRTPC